jgi:hypothetical protein
MTEADRELNKYDREIEGKTDKKIMSIDELRLHLKRALEPNLPANFPSLSKTQLNAFTLVGWGKPKGCSRSTMNGG